LSKVEIFSHEANNQSLSAALSRLGQVARGNQVIAGCIVNSRRDVAVETWPLIRRLDILALGFLTAFCAPSVWAQAAPTGKSDQPVSSPPLQTQSATTISVQVKVVNVLATVRDKHGKIVNNLTKDDFTLAEDGHPQTIHYFTRETDLPLTLGLLVDTSMSQRRVLDQERSASHGFLDQMVRVDKDKAFIIHFDREVDLLQDLTSSHEKLESALGSLTTPQFSRTSGDSPDQGSEEGRGSGRHHMGGGTLLYDAVYLASDELMKKQQGRKALIVLSDGVDRGSKESLETSVATAQRADTAVYSILYKDDEGYGEHRSGFGMGGPMGGGGMGRHGGAGRFPRPDGKKILARISKETGGRLFEVSKKQPVDQIYSQIEEELRNQYSLGYTPERGGAPDDGYHKIQLTTKQKDLVVQSREGYYASQ
jgi:VWFA-related protein